MVWVPNVRVRIQPMLLAYRLDARCCLSTEAGRDSNPAASKEIWQDDVRARMAGDCMYMST